jgi:general secretion pathway protein F
MFFEVKAYSERDGVVILNYDAADAGDAIHKAQAQGYQVISSKASFAWRRLGRRDHFPLTLFSQELLSLLDAGLSLLEAIETLAEKEQQSKALKVYRDLIRLLHEGQALSNALDYFPDVFPPLYIATVRASEKTGDLKQALTRYLAYQTQLDTIRKKVVSAAIYPAVLLVVGSLVIFFLLAYVVPKFSHVYADMGDNLPYMSRMLLAWGALVEAHGGVILLGTTGVVLACGYWLSRPATRQQMWRVLWKIPAVGQRMHVYQLARLYRTLGMLLRSGIPIVTGLGMVSGLLQAGFRDNLRNASQAVSEGRPLSESLDQYGLANEVALRMLRVGERSGNLGEMMERIAKFYDEDMARWVDWFTRLFEPLLMVFIGLVIGAIVLLMYFPIFELAGSIQ